MGIPGKVYAAPSFEEMAEMQANEEAIAEQKKVEKTQEAIASDTDEIADKEE